MDEDYICLNVTEVLLTAHFRVVFFCGYPVINGDTLTPAMTL